MFQANTRGVPRMASTIDEYYGLRPGRFGPIHALEFTQEQTAEGIGHRVRIVLSEAPEMNGPWLTLEFRGVSGLVFSQPGWSVATLGLVEIRENGTGFSVTEEEGNLRLQCQSFEATVDAALKT